MENKVIAVSGGFDPVHIGHLRMFKAAKELVGEKGKLIVILNGDTWLKRKKGYCFMPAEQRKELIEAIEYVDEVRICDHDTRDDIAWALEEIKPDFFANGGDRKVGSTPEVGVCTDIGIEMVFGVGGEKAESSSALAQRAWEQKHIFHRPWGSYTLYENQPLWALKTLAFLPGEETSLQSHEERDEYWMLVEGEAKATGAGEEVKLTPGFVVHVPKGMKHRLVAGEMGATIVEIIYGTYREEDITRYEDKHGRV